MRTSYQFFDRRGVQQKKSNNKQNRSGLDSREVRGTGVLSGSIVGNSMRDSFASMMNPSGGSDLHGKGPFKAGGITSKTGIDWMKGGNAAHRGREKNHYDDGILASSI